MQNILNLELSSIPMIELIGSIYFYIAKNKNRNRYFVNYRMNFEVEYLTLGQLELAELLTRPGQVWQAEQQRSLYLSERLAFRVSCMVPTSKLHP